MSNNQCKDNWELNTWNISEHVLVFGSVVFNRFVPKRVNGLHVTVRVSEKWRNRQLITREPVLYLLVTNGQLRREIYVSDAYMSGQYTRDVNVIDPEEGKLSGRDV